MEIRSFTRAERVRLLQFVREALERDLAGAELPAPPPFPRLAETGSCFVTLKEAGELRGCIGNIEAFEPLGENLLRNAINASQSDPRFPPLEAEELPFILIELSILTPASPIASAEEFRIGQDGIILRLGGRGARAKGIHAAGGAGAALGSGDDVALSFTQSGFAGRCLATAGGPAVHLSGGGFWRRGVRHRVSGLIREG